MVDCELEQNLVEKNHSEIAFDPALPPKKKNDPLQDDDQQALAYDNLVNLVNNIDPDHEPNQVYIECLNCFKKFISKKQSNPLPCGHFFCSNCWSEYLLPHLNNGKVINFKCIQQNCNTDLTHLYLVEITKSNSTLYDLYLRAIAMEYSRTKYCPNDNCNALIGKRNDKYVQCPKGHKFCFICMNDWHDTEPCKRNINVEYEKWKPKRILKQCPNCNYITEREKKDQDKDCVQCKGCKGYWCWKCVVISSFDHMNKQSKCLRSNNFSDEKLPAPVKYIGMWFAAMFFSVLVYTYYCGMQIIYEDEYEKEEGANCLCLSLPICIISICMFICYQVFFTCLTSIVLVPCLFYWPWLEFVVVDIAIDIFKTFILGEI